MAHPPSPDRAANIPELASAVPEPAPLAPEHVLPDENQDEDPKEDLAEDPEEEPEEEMKELLEKLQELSEKGFVRPSSSPPKRYGRYEFQGMPFGLTNAPAIFMDLMNRVCKLYLDKFMTVFTDDIIIYSKNKEYHGDHLKIILELLKKEQMYAKLSKCDFWLDSV
ncbi:putative reverse transcriptase domain-containing protein [Tanacetum coccineum]